MTRDIRWAAGLFEGEGWAGFYRLTSYYKTQTYTYTRARATINMTDLDVLQEFHRIIGVGTLSGPHKGGRKPRWQWQVSKPDDVRAALTRLHPYMLGRRAEQINAVLTAKEAS